MIPYGRQWIDEDDIQAVVDVLRSDWLTTGPKVEEFENALARTSGAKHAVAVSSGTAALHAAMFALGIGPGDEVIVPTMTFAATANCVVYQGGIPVFADVLEDNLLIDPEQVSAKITPRTKAVIAVDYAGHPCDYDELRRITDPHGITLVADACHALGGSYRGQPVGSLAELTAFSFHPVKHVTTGEGGAVTTADGHLAERVRMFRNHGIDTDRGVRAQEGTWFYQMVELGYNYRITDFQCALGASQLRKLHRWLERRRAIAATYDAAFGEVPGLEPLAISADVNHAYHLYVLKLDLDLLGCNRAAFFTALRERGVGVNVHYVPVHLHPFYRERFGTGPGLCPVAEAAYERILSFPIFGALSDGELQRVIDAALSVAQDEIMVRT